MESTIRHQYDADLALRAPGGAAVTADTSSAAIDIYRITQGRGDVNGRYGIGSFDIVAYFSALDTSGDATYALKIETTDADGANAVTHATIPLTAANLGAPLVYAFHPATLKVSDADGAKVRVTLDVTGTTPSANFWAFVAPHSHY
jgi:hypothetical protein